MHSGLLPELSLYGSLNFYKKTSNLNLISNFEVTTNKLRIYFYFQIRKNLLLREKCIACSLLAPWFGEGWLKRWGGGGNEGTNMAGSINGGLMESCRVREVNCLHNDNRNNRTLGLMALLLHRMMLPRSTSMSMALRCKYYFEI